MSTQDASVMNVQKIDLAAIRQFSSFFLDYLAQQPDLQPFYGHFPRIENFEKQINQKKFSSEQREALHAVVKEQYQHIHSFPDVQIDSYAMKILLLLPPDIS